MPYEHLAFHYDELMTGMDYEAYADYLLSFTNKSALSVLDLACGTGRLAEALCGRGCDVTAADGSPEMLTVAQNRFAETDGGTDTNRPLYLLQDMTQLDLYGTVEAVFCTLDALNYLTTPKKLKQALSRVRLFLEPGGVFVFDMLTPKALASRDGMVFMSDSGKAYCVWRCSWEAPLCRQDMTLFTREGALWRRSGETHVERAYELPEVTSMLREAGFSEVSQYAFMTKNPPDDDTERVVFVAK